LGEGRPGGMVRARLAQTFAMTQILKIDFISDVVCPWCVIGLGALNQALASVGDLVRADIHFQPFELNPDMPAEGEDIAEHVAQKYGATPEQSAANREIIRARAAEVGFTMAPRSKGRIYNTFDAHRLLHWAELEGRQAALKTALFTAYFTDAKAVSDRAVLVAAAQAAGLDAEATREVLETGAYADVVREVEAFWRRNGVNAVPTLVFNDRYMITGGQPAHAFEKAIRSMAAEMAATGVPDLAAG
jgi:predicted DsbA family dithiol-disulfide isomerase